MREQITSGSCCRSSTAEQLADRLSSELCDALDSDCDGSLVDEFDDTDGDLDPDCTDPDDDDDGDSDATDCAPLDALIHAGAAESCDSVDSNCDGSLVDGFTDTDGDLEPDCVDLDDDADGDPDSSDCAPLDASAHAGAAESCDTVDSDCDGSLVDEYTDSDLDGVPDCVDADADGDGYETPDDCDDDDASVYPGASETADDGVDQDCSGADTVTCFTDGDGDGWGGATTLLGGDGDCDDPGESDLDTDCDDADPSTFPGATETADDGIDQDCSGADTVTCYVDADGDGWGGTSTQLSSDGDCLDFGESALDTDCDDGSDSVHPGATEYCDLFDSDCDGSLVDGYDDTDVDGIPDCVEDDTDGDGFADDEDCVPDDDSIFPGATDILDDGIDQDCNGTDAVTCHADGDGDGFGSDPVVPDPDGDCDDDGQAYEPGDCDDSDPSRHPAAAEVCADGIDQDCDGAERAGRDDPECWPGGCSGCDSSETLLSPLPRKGLLMFLPGLLLLARRRRGERSRRIGTRTLPVVLVLATLFAAGSAWAGSEEEAARQLDFARTELTNEQPDRALKSAESALRLCPTCYDAMVVKALAYEQLGELRLAESLLLAYVELTGEAAASTEARGHLARLQATTSSRQRRPGESPPSTTSPVEVTVSPVAGLDLGPYRERVRTALDQGQCQAARSAASELTLAAPAQAEGWRLAGDAARCSGDMREAVRSYRRYVDRDGSEASVLEMIDALAANLATVRVRLELAEGSTVPVVGLDTGEEYLAPFAASDVELLFGDLPVATPMVVSLTGRGLQAEYREVQPMAPGEELTLELAPVWIGLGQVRVSEHEASLCRTTFVSSDDSLGVGPGQEVTITAGEFTARVENDNGALEVPLEVPPEGSIDFAPERHLPASLTVVDLPAGSEVRVFVETPNGEMVEQTTNLPADTGEINETTGVRLAPPQKFLSLRGGSGGVFVSHPSLGNAPATLVLENGKVNAWTYPWRSLEGVPRVQAAYESWQGEVALARRGQQRTGALAVVSAILVGTGAALLVGSAVQDGVLASSRSDGLSATEGGTDEDALESAWQSNLAAQQTRTGLLIGGSVGLGLGGAGLVVTIVSGGSAKKSMAKVGAWDPAEVE